MGGRINGKKNNTQLVARPARRGAPSPPSRVSFLDIIFLSFAPAQHFAVARGDEGMDGWMDGWSQS